MLSSRKQTFDTDYLVKIFRLTQKLELSSNILLFNSSRPTAQRNSLSGLLSVGHTITVLPPHVTANRKRRIPDTRHHLGLVDFLSLSVKTNIPYHALNKHLVDKTWSACQNIFFIACSYGFSFTLVTRPTIFHQIFACDNSVWAKYNRQREAAWSTTNSRNFNSYNSLQRVTYLNEFRYWWRANLRITTNLSVFCCGRDNRSSALEFCVVSLAAVAAPQTAENFLWTWMFTWFRVFWLSFMLFFSLPPKGKEEGVRCQCRFSFHLSVSLPFLLFASLCQLLLHFTDLNTHTHTHTHQKRFSKKMVQNETTTEYLSVVLVLFLLVHTVLCWTFSLANCNGNRKEMFSGWSYSRP